MAKFKKEGKPSPAISTASLPDIVFMLLFFFMVSTVLREQDLKVEQKIPKATQLQKIEEKTLVSYIYVGKPKKKDLGTDPKIQVNDVFITPKEIPLYVEKEKAKLREADREKITMSLKVDSDVKMGMLTDIKLELRKVNARKLNYATIKREGTF